MINIDLPDEAINNKKCYSCGKIFLSPSDLVRHKERKTPCLIRDIPDNQRMNPNRCIFCNKILVNKSTLTRHHKLCKIKNGGMEILDEKVKYDQELRIIKEQFEKDRKKMEEIEKNHKKTEDDNIIMREHIINLTASFEQLKTVLIGNVANISPGIINNTTNNTTNVNQTINITINNHYLNPDIDHLINGENINDCVLAKLFKQKMLMTPMESVKLIWFDPEILKNHSIYPANSKGDLLICGNGEWTRDNIYEGLGKNIRDKTYAIIDIVFDHADFNPTFENANDYVKRVKNYRHDPALIKIDCDRILKTIMENKGMISSSVVSQVKQFANEDTRVFIRQEQKRKAC